MDCVRAGYTSLKLEQLRQVIPQPPPLLLLSRVVPLEERNHKLTPGF